MAQKMTGALVFDERTDRYDILDGLTAQNAPQPPAQGAETAA